MERKIRSFIHRYVFLKNHSIQKKLIVYFSILIVIPLFLVGALSYISAASTIQEKVSTYVSDMMIQANKNIDFYFQDLDTVGQSIFFDRNLKENLILSRKGKYEQAKAYQKINQILTGLMYPRRHIKQIFIVDEMGSLFSTSSDTRLDLLRQQDWFAEVEGKKRDKMVVPTHDASFYTFNTVSNNIGPVITMARQLVDVQTNSRLGVLVIDLDYRVVEKIFRDMNIEGRGELFLISPQGIIAYHKEEKMIGNYVDEVIFHNALSGKNGSYRYKMKGVDSLIIYNTSGITGWKIVEIIPMSALTRDAVKVRNTTIGIGVLCMMMALLVSVGFSYNISNPIRKLRSLMKLVESGELDVNVHIDSRDEIGQLSQSFNQMIKKIHLLIDRIYQEEKEKKEAELHALQAQINPHFLYNTLGVCKTPQAA